MVWKREEEKAEEKDSEGVRRKTPRWEAGRSGDLTPKIPQSHSKVETATAPARCERRYLLRFRGILLCFPKRSWAIIFRRFFFFFLSQKICMASTGKCNSVVKTV